MAVSRQRYTYNAPSAGTHYLYLDLWYNTSSQERKLHPQFRTCNVMGGALKDSNQLATIAVNVAPHHWVTKTALRRGKRMFDDMVEKAISDSKTNVKPKWHDYKVYLNDSMRSGTMLYPKDAEGSNITKGEWNYSEYHSEDVNWAALPTTTNRQADSFTAHIVGEHVGSATNWTSIALIESWFKSRGQLHNDTPVVPAGMSSDPLVNLMDASDNQDEVLDMLDTYNDRPPYDEDNQFGYVGGAGNAPGRGLQRVAFAATQAGAGSVAPLNGFSAICGLVEIKLDVQEPGLVEILLDVDTNGVKI